jgi:hypothetical protein
MRPRANTISHVDGAAMHLIAAANANVARNAVASGPHGHSRHASLVGLPMHGDYSFGGMSTAMNQRGLGQGLPKIDTNAFNPVDFSSGLRTAPIVGGMAPDFDFEGLLFGPGSTTINPNALHYNDSPQSMAIDSASPFHQNFPEMNAGHSFDENFDWMNGFEHQLNFGSNENAIDGSSPSAISTASQSGISEVMLDGSNNPTVTSGAMWQHSMMAPMMTPHPPFSLDLSGSGFPDLMNGGPMSPHSLPQKNINDPYFSTPPPSMSSLSPSVLPGLTTSGLHQAMTLGPETPTSSSGSPHMSSAASSITEATRQSLLVALAQCSPYGGRKYSFTSTASPLSPHFTGRPSVSEGSMSLPKVSNLQRYVSAYIRYFHPHLPFLHIPTLSFDVSAYTPTTRGQLSSGVLGGRGCLLLSMAAIGALYEMEQIQSRELFDSAKKMIQLYLEERRKEDIRRAEGRKAGHFEHEAHENETHTPVWLVQAMLLNVVYGHNCGDKIAGDIASTHCTALVSLARAADLPSSQNPPTTILQDVQMTEDEMILNEWSNGIKHESSDESSEWHIWKLAEERKRTLYAVFILSSLLVSAYNHAPALTNSEIMLDLPCDEEYWAAESAAIFEARGGVKMANHNQVTFHDALGELLRTSERQHQMANANMFGGSPELPHSDLKPSTFGCLVLINALHNYIWETRQRHHSKVWTNEETEKMHRHIEPALKAWQAAWASNPQHSLERPNPYGLGPLSADSIPLLDLAYVRLFVNLSRSKEKFWQRDYDGMAEELSRGSEIIQHAEHSPQSNSDSSAEYSESSSSTNFHDSPLTDNSSPDYNSNKVQQQQNPPVSSTTKRERHLRKAAFYAADSLSMSDKLGVTFADFTSRELPLQSAMCAFDCAQVLAEWIVTVQERVGRYLGILGRDEVDFGMVPAIMLLEEEDVKLLGKIEEVLRSANVKMEYEMAALGGQSVGMVGMNGMNGLAEGESDGGYAGKILKVTGHMLDKAAVWPGKSS